MTIKNGKIKEGVSNESPYSKGHKKSEERTT
jgi:hypothetical protein